MGGTDGTAPSTGVWKSQLTTTAPVIPGPWVAQNPLVEPNVDGVAMHVGDFVFLIGGSNATGPVATVQVGTLGGPDAVPANPNDDVPAVEDTARRRTCRAPGRTCRASRQTA